jgi:hypothetical protein
VLLIREVARVVRDLATFALFQRRLGLLVVIAVVVAIVLLSATVTTVGPVLVYPLI